MTNLQKWMPVAAALALAAPWAVAVDLSPDIGGGAYSVPVKSMKDLLTEARFRTTIKQKYDYSCGSAALATLLTHHYASTVSEEEAILVMIRRGDKDKITHDGFSLLDMKQFLEYKGFKADGFEATLEQIMQFGAPGIVLVQDNGYKHFVVLKGVKDGQVLLGDPALGSRILPRADFERIWVNHIFFVIHSHRNAQFNVAAHWQVRPSAFLGNAIDRDSLARITLLRSDPRTDF